MMQEKKTKQIAVRITEETYKTLETEAAKLEWSKAKLAEKILSEWTKAAHSENGGSIHFIINNNNAINITK